jgi:hypothetical protein
MMNDQSASGLNGPSVIDIFQAVDLCRTLARETPSAIVPIRLQMVGFQIVADCNLGGERISDLLNQSLSDYLDCTNAKVFRDGKLIEQVGHVKIRKPEIIYAGIVGDTHEAAEKRIGSRRTLSQFPVFLAVDRWIMRGRVHLSSKRSANAFLCSEREFFPVQDAEVMDVDSSKAAERMAVAVVNRAKVSIMEIAEVLEPESHASASLASRLEL